MLKSIFNIQSRLSKPKQYVLSIGLIILVGFFCSLFVEYIDYRGVALILLMFLSLNAMIFDIFPVLISAFASALIWIWFFIPPVFTWVVKSTEDKMMIVMYFIVALVNTVLTSKIRAIEKKMNQKIEKERSLNLYNALLNSLSHELRTPIATILGASDNLQDDTHLDETTKKELIGEISKASIRLNTQVENLLNMSRLESDHLSIKLDWCDIHELINEVLNELDSRIENRKIVVSIQEQIPLCKLDFGLMEQVLQNLILNAHLYTPKDLPITLSAGIDQNTFIITVEDYGKGFPEKEIPFVFDKFYRLKDTNISGTGLGLFITKGFVEAHHGTITLENRLGGGAKFTIAIPTSTNDLNKFENE